MWDNAAPCCNVASPASLVGHRRAGAVALRRGAAAGVLRSPLLPAARRRRCTATLAARHARADSKRRSRGAGRGNFFTRRPRRACAPRSSACRGCARAAVRRVVARPARGRRSRSTSPLARWGERARCVNTHGERFAGATSDGELPLFSGPAGSEARGRAPLRALQRDRSRRSAPGRARAAHARGALAAASSTTALHARARPRRRRCRARLARFVAAYARRSAARGREPLDYVDLRYPNGLRALRASHAKPTRRRA